MVRVKQNVIYKRNYLDGIGAFILNNPFYSDVTFVVNRRHFHTCRIVMSAASEEFEAMITEHFNNSADRKVLVTDVTHAVSFHNILKYIHGVEIDLSSMSPFELCEMLSLTEKYALHNFHTDLKTYCSKLNRFKLNSVVALLNTAKTYNIGILYEKLKIYVYQHVRQFITRKSFVCLKYDVLLDMLTSEWFYFKEIDILLAALNWLDKNIMDAETDKEILVKTILEQIRFARIPASEFIRAQNTATFAKYDTIIMNLRNDVERNDKPRNVYSGNSRRFTITVKGILEDSSILHSKECHSSKYYQWNIMSQVSKVPYYEGVGCMSEEKYLGIYLCCNSKQRKWKSIVSAKISLISHDPLSKNKCVFLVPTTFSYNRKYFGFQKFISFSELVNPNNHFLQNDTITIEVYFEYPTRAACKTG